MTGATVPKTRYAVSYTMGGRECVARFSEHSEAMCFARFIARNAEVQAVGGKGPGLVGQYRNGETTPEFQLHHGYTDWSQSARWRP